MPQGYPARPYGVGTMHGAPTHGMRTVRGCNTPNTGAFTRGNRRGWQQGITRAEINVDLQPGGLLTRTIIRPAGRPMHDMPDPDVKIVKKAMIYLCGSCMCVAHAGECW